MTKTRQDIDLTMTEKTTSGDIFWFAVGLAVCLAFWLSSFRPNILLGVLTLMFAAAVLVGIYRYQRGPLRNRFKVSASGIYESRACKAEIPWREIEGLRTGPSLSLQCRDRIRFANDTWKDRLWEGLPWRKKRPIDIKTLDYLGVDEERERLVPLILKYHPPSRGAAMNPPPPGMP